MKLKLLILFAVPACLACSGECICPDAVCSCPDGSGEGDADAEDAADEAAFRPDLAGCRPADPPSAAPDMYLAVLERLTTSVPVNEGDWGEDFGDATAYAPPALLEAGLLLCDVEAMELASETLDHLGFLVSHYMEILEGGEPDEVLIGVLAPIEAYGIVPHEGWAADADEGLMWLNDTLELFSDYLYGPAVDTSPYGPTAVTAIVAAENLRYVQKVDPADSEKIDRALEIAGAIDLYAWNEEGGFYLASPDGTELDLYPNVAMMIVWTLAHAVTGEESHLARAEELFGAVAPLKLEELGAYHSLYSSSVPDYVSLSSQNYMMFALHLLHAETGDAAYRDEAMEILGFVSSRLYYNGMAWHHWENGARANWYCSGCNFQLLYVISLLSR